MKIKVCGINDLKTLESCASLPIDYLGFIFYKKSPRFCNNIKATDINMVPLHIKKVGVFVNENYDSIQRICDSYQLTHVQLHGNESAELCRQLISTRKVIKAISVLNIRSLQQCEIYRDVCDYFLFDTAGKNPGGNGKLFNHKLLNEYPISKKFFLSGGIDFNYNSNNNEQKQAYALDINSKFEIVAGVKNINLIQSFIHKIKSNGIQL